MKFLLYAIFVLFLINPLIGQIENVSCSFENMMAIQNSINPNAEEEQLETEERLQNIIRNFRENRTHNFNSQFVIPVVMHVFHNGEDGKMDMEQIASGLKRLNDDFNGLNEGWNSVDPEFDNIKASLDITFCLAKIDPNGNPTSGVNYYEDSLGMLNQGNLYQHAWDNFKYLNIYFPKYTNGQPSNFTGYATFPSVSNSNNQRDGIFYSSIRWGYGNKSELEEGDDWASVGAHEAGHWLNLRHTFQGGCGNEDLVDDTPPTLGSGIELSGCYNNDFTCGVRTNGENFMDYNHRCKKMFTTGQVERMLAALYLPSRIDLWSQANLEVTGCIDFLSNTSNVKIKEMILIYPNPASETIHFQMNQKRGQLIITNSKGSKIGNYELNKIIKQINISSFANGIYFYSIISDNGISSGKFLVQK